MARAYSILILILITGLSFSQEKPLIIGMKQSAPFTMQDANQNWSGISTELWAWIAEDLNLNYEIKMKDLKGLLNGVQTNDLDVSVGALTITEEREELFDFTNSFYNTGLSIAVRKEGKGFLGILKSLWDPEFIKVIAYLLLGLILMTTMVWFFEKRHNNNPRTNHSDVHGMGWSFWWAVITLIGYDDAQPVSMGGRIIAVIWMIASVVGISILTAVLTTTLTVNSLESSIKGPEDLKATKGPTATIVGSSSAEYLIKRNIPFAEYASIEEALQAVADSKADGFVYDRPLLRYSVKNNFPNNLTVINVIFEPQNYAFALPSGSLHREEINRAILKFTSQERWKDLLTKYLGE